MGNRKRWWLPPQDYGVLFRPAQIAAIRKARERSKRLAEAQQGGEPEAATPPADSLNQRQTES